MAKIAGWAARKTKAPLERIDYDAGPLGPDEVEIAVEHCGICHSDLSMIDNEWGMSRYPLVPGHEVVGTIAAVGDRAKGRAVGQQVGLGWNADSCMHCRPCVSGNQHLCAKATGTIVGRHGGFADRVRSHWAWTIPVPDGLDVSATGPLLCGGVTVFAPLVEFDVRPTHRAAVVGIGGLGHMALKFLNAWGCEVSAVTSSESKFDEAKALGAHNVVSSKDAAAVKAMAGTLDLLLVTVNVPIDWKAMIDTLGPKGRLHVVGAVLKPIPVGAFDLIMQQRSVSGSPTGSPAVMATMLDFAARHKIAPQVEHFPMAKVNDALQHLRDGKSRYRVVLDN